MSTAQQVAANQANGIGGREPENCPPSKKRGQREYAVLVNHVPSNDHTESIASTIVCTTASWG
jgi:hypothetical protein